jgi:hypothetical protein
MTKPTKQITRFIEDHYQRSMDEFHPVPDFEDYYEINLMGQIRTKPRWVNSPICGGKRLLPVRYLKTQSPLGYPMFSVKVDGKRNYLFVHKTLARIFIPNPDNKPEINHKDGNRKNFSLENLEWCTHQENMAHAFRTGLAPLPKTGKGEASPSAKLTDEKVKQIKELLREGVSKKAIADQFGVRPGTIWFIADGSTWSHIEP